MHCFKPLINDLCCFSSKILSFKVLDHLSMIWCLILSRNDRRSLTFFFFLSILRWNYRRCFLRRSLSIFERIWTLRSVFIHIIQKNRNLRVSPHFLKTFCLLSSPCGRSKLRKIRLKTAVDIVLFYQTSITGPFSIWSSVLTILLNKSSNFRKTSHLTHTVRFLCSSSKSSQLRCISISRIKMYSIKQFLWTDF